MNNNAFTIYNTDIDAMYLQSMFPQTRQRSRTAPVEQKEEKSNHTWADDRNSVLSPRPSVRRVGIEIETKQDARSISLAPSETQGVRITGPDEELPIPLALKRSTTTENDQAPLMGQLLSMFD
jgi:hypothetical protein